MLENGDLEPITSPEGSVAHSNLLYVDDVLLFCKGKHANLMKVFYALNFYGDLSGQQISWDKSFMFFGEAITPIR